MKQNEQSMKTMNFKVLLISAILWFSCSSQDKHDIELQMENDTGQKQEKNTFKYLALGDSYTIGESVGVNERFPVQLVKQLNETGIKIDLVTIIARTGWTTYNLSEGIKNSGISGTFDLVTLLIGVNNQYQGRDTIEYRIQFRELLQTAIDFAENTEKKVIVISIPDYGVTPFAKYGDTLKIASEIDIYNKINREETELRKAYYVNITSISRVARVESSLIAPDGLHPSGAMYKLWVESIFPVAKFILNNQ